MARIIHPMETFPQGRIPKETRALLRRLGLPAPSDKAVAAPAKARSSGPGAPVTAQRRPATPKDTRSMPKVGPKAPLVEHVTIKREELQPECRHCLTTETIGCWRIRWDEVSVSQNVLMRKYANHHAYGRLVTTWEQIFWTAMREGGIPKATGKRRLTITRYVRDGKYLLDRVNFAGGFKPYLDAAVRAGLILDDREGDLDDHYKQSIEPDERIEILVENI